MSMMNNMTSCAPSSCATPGMAAIRASLRDRTVAGDVVSRTDTRRSVPSTVYSFESIRSSSASEKADTSDFAANISAAKSGIDTPRSLANASATALSWGVVVGERNSSVSDRMHDSIRPLIPSGAWPRWSPIRSCMMVAVQARGRIVMSIGPFVSSPPTSLWWSMIARKSALLIEAGSSAGLLVSTMTTA